MVREARPDDADAIARVHVASWHAAYQTLIPADRLAAFTVRVRAAAWRHNLETGSVRAAVFEDPGGVRGFSAVGPSRDLIGWGEIWALYVDPSMWGRGVGSALFADALTALTERRFDQVLLWVLEGNERALRFYQGGGFVLDGTRKVESGLPQLRLRRWPPTARASSAR
ncbi:MAG: GNAT family N-acetyltransferase [Myxococcales bacterium]|nr:GNAT family N-acetyltransferase [Myxococcales bacterium]